MIIYRTSQSAVQAMIYTETQPPLTPALNKDVASQLNIPTPYFLSKIMQVLAKGNLLCSFRGRTGGIQMTSQRPLSRASTVWPTCPAKCIPAYRLNFSETIFRV
jgi:DNA-binding IscR family transcriptional regulator